MSEKKTLPTLLLCLFLGFLGAHRFYVGKTRTGILQLVTLGGVGLWALVDLIMIIKGGFSDKEGKKLQPLFGAGTSAQERTGPQPASGEGFGEKLGRLFAPLMKLGFLANMNFGSTVGIYVGIKDVYIAQMNQTILGPRVTRFGKVEIQSQGEAQSNKEQKQYTIQAIRRAFAENNITSKRIVTALAGKDVLIRYFQLPKIPKEEWENAIKFEAKKYIPFKIDDLFWDFHVVLSKDKNDKMDVTFAAAKKEVAQRHLSLLEEAGFKPTILEPAPFSLLRLFTWHNQLDKNRPTAIVDINYGIADINIVKNKTCYLTRDVSVPLQEELIFESLLNEIRMSLDYYEKLFPGETIGKVLLCGEVEHYDWDLRLAQELKMPVEKAIADRAIKAQHLAVPINMAAAIGLALSGLTKIVAEVNLLHPHKLKPKAALAKETLKITPEIRQAIMRAIAISCIGLVILYIIMYYRISRFNKQLKEVIALRPKISLPIGSLSYPEVEAKKKALEDKLLTLRRVIEERTLFTPKLNELPKIIPAEVWLTSINFTESGAKREGGYSLVINGTAYHEDPVEVINIITKMVSRLKEDIWFSRSFKTIKLESMQPGRFEGMTVKQFRIACSSK